MAYFPKRQTGITEIIVAEKHNRIFPEDNQLMLIQETVLFVEKALKKVADALAAVAKEEERLVLLQALKAPGAYLFVNLQLIRLGLHKFVYQLGVVNIFLIWD